MGNNSTTEPNVFECWDCGGSEFAVDSTYPPGFPTCIDCGKIQPRCPHCRDRLRGQVAALSEIESLLQDAFLAGFRASGEGMNGDIARDASVPPWEDAFCETDAFETVYTNWRDAYEIPNADFE